MNENLEKYLKYTIYSGLFLSLFIPLFISNSLFFPFITGKNFAFRILTEISFGAWIILALNNSLYRPRKGLVFWAVTSFVAIIFIADLFGSNFFKSFWSNFERMEGFVTLLHFWAYFVLLISVINTKNLWSKLLNTSLVVSVLVGLRGFLQFFGFFISTQSGSRLDATFGNAAYLAAYMLFNVFIALYLLSRNWDNKKWKWIYLSVAVFDAFILLFSATRGAILGLIGGLILTALIVAWFEKGNKELKKWSIGFLGLIVIVSTLFFALKSTPIIQKVEPLKRIANISLQDTTTQSRFMIWGISYEGFKEKPLLGWGQGNFTFVFDKHYNPEMYNQEPWFDRAHNIFFDWLIAGGILGLLAYLSIFISALWILWKKTNFNILETGIFTGLLAAYFFQNLFVFDNVTTYILFAFVLAFLCHKEDESKQNYSESDLTGKRSLIPYSLSFPIVAVLTVFMIYFFNVPGIRASDTLIDALSTQSEEGPRKNLELYQQAINFNTYGTPEIRERLASTALNLAAVQGIPNDVKQNFINVAKTEMIKQVEEGPASARSLLVLSNFLNGTGSYNEALQFLEKAKEISPKKQQIYFEMTTSYLGKGELSRALESAKFAYELTPEFDNARIIYSIALIYNGQAQAAQDLLEERFGVRIYPDERLARTYIRNGLIDPTIKTWQALININPNNTTYRFALASVYLQIGSRQQSIGVLEEISQINPNLTDQVNFYISEIRAGRNP